MGVVGVGIQTNKQSLKYKLGEVVGGGGWGL